VNIHRSAGRAHRNDQRGHIARTCCLLAFCLLLSLIPATAQTITATVRGTILDESGAVLSKSSVTATNVNTGVKTKTITGQDGLYSIQFLTIGTYTITATAPGFETATVGPFELQIDQIAKVDIKMKIGSVSASVQVEAETSPVLETEHVTLGTSFSSKMLENISVDGDNFQTLTLFMPGAVNPGYSTNSTAGAERQTNASSGTSFNGNRQQGNNYVLDGIEINETLNNLAGYNPNPEALQEMRVISANADAEYGGVNGGEMLMVTKGGTNKIHGSLYDRFRDQLMAANTYSNNRSGIAKTVFHQSMFGATIGGPIKKNKLFYFGDYEGVRNVSAGTGTASVASAAMRTGDFSELLTANKIQLYNTTNGTKSATPYTNNQIPINNSVAKYLFAHPEVYPLPNHASASASSTVSSNYHAPTQKIIVNDQGDLRVDYTMNTKDTLMGRFSVGDAYDATTKTPLAITFPASNDYPFHSVVANWVHVFSPALINEFRTGYTRVFWRHSIPNDTTGEFGINGNNVVGIPFTNQAFEGFSAMTFASGITSVGNAAIATTYVENTFNYGDNFTWQRGKHLTKFGAQIARYQQNNFYPGNDGALGTFDYGTEYTFNPNVKTGKGYPFAEFVMDEAYFSGVGGVAGPVGQRQFRDSFYVQDDWKFRPNLTFNVGVRYGYDQPIYEVNNKQLNVDISNPSTCTSTSGCLEYAGKNGNSRALYKSFFGEVMPRFGFAWQINPRNVLRGGYGITDYMEGTGSNLRLTMNAPFLYQYEDNATTPTTTSGGSPIATSTGFSSGSKTTIQTTYRAWDKNLRPTFVQQYNLTWQYLFLPHTSLQTSYVGEIAQHLIVPVELNEWTAVGGGPTAAPFYNLVGNTGVVDLTESEGVSNYNALQMVLHGEHGQRLQYTVNYTWSKAMTNNPGFYTVNGVSGANSFWQDIRNPRADYGPSAFDTRQAINGTLIFKMPFGRKEKWGSNLNSVVDKAVGGWRLSGNAFFYDGFPVTITSPNNANLNAPTARANQYRKLIIKNQSKNNWFGTDASVTACTGADDGICAYGYEQVGKLGTAHVNTERAPNYKIVNMSIFKTFPTIKGETLEFRMDGYNILNMSSYSAPNNSVSSASFGEISSTVSPARQFQFNLRYLF